MRICVTGAAGFIGQRVMQALHDYGNECVGMDVRKPDGLGLEWVYDEWVDADIRSPLKPIPGLDAVIHLAAIAAPRECDTDPSRAYAVNVAGTQHVLQMAKASGARKVVFSSTAHVYDIPPKYLPSDESHPLRLNNTYTTTKLLGEQLCQLFWENHGLSYTTLRLYNAYGPGQRLGYFIPDQLAKARLGRIDLKGGDTTKDWVYIDDVARAFVLAVGSSFVGPINIGTGKETKLTDIASYICLKTGAVFRETLDYTPTRMCADINRARFILGWDYTKGIYDGLTYCLNETAAVSA